MHLQIMEQRAGIGLVKGCIDSPLAGVSLPDESAYVP